MKCLGPKSTISWRIFWMWIKEVYPLEEKMNMAIETIQTETQREKKRRKKLCTETYRLVRQYQAVYSKYNWSPKRKGKKQNSIRRNNVTFSKTIKSANPQTQEAQWTKAGYTENCIRANHNQVAKNLFKNILKTNWKIYHLILKVAINQ